MWLVTISMINEFKTLATKAAADPSNLSTGLKTHLRRDSQIFSSSWEGFWGFISCTEFEQHWQRSAKNLQQTSIPCASYLHFTHFNSILLVSSIEEKKNLHILSLYHCLFTPGVTVAGKFIKLRLISRLLFTLKSAKCLLNLISQHPYALRGNCVGGGSYLTSTSMFNQQNDSLNDRLWV